MRPLSPEAHRARLDSPTRLAALDATGLVASRANAVLDRYSRTASRLLGVPIALVSLIDGQAQHFVGLAGLGGPAGEARGTPLSHSFCQHVVATQEPLVVVDAAEHPLVRDNLAFTELGVVAYAGVPLTTSSGETLGAFCAIDTAPREWTADQLEGLHDLAAAAMAKIELRLAHRSLAEREARFRGILETVRSAAVCLDRDGRVTFCNDFLLEVTGWARDEVMGADWFGRFVPAGAGLGAEFAAHLARGEVPPHAEHDVHARDGGRRTLRWDSTLLRDDTGQVVGAARLGQDVTERVRAERYKDQLIGVVSHELRSPLNGVFGALQLLALDPPPPPEEQRELLDVAVQSAEVCLRLTNDLVDLERIEGGGYPLDRRPVDAAAALQRACDLTQVAAAAAGVRVVVRPPAALRAWADADRLVQVLVNLAGNAVKFSPRGGTVTLSADAAPPAEAGGAPAVHFRVRDEGRGIPPDALGRVFERFAQVDADDARVKGGAGLGLAISRALVERHGGRIWVESAVGAGSTFQFTVPAAPPAPVPLPAPAPPLS